MSRQSIAEELLGVSLDVGGFAQCPGYQHHTTGKGRKDFRVVLDGAPTGYCFHTHCGEEVDAFNKELRRRIWFEENGTSPAPRGSWGEGVAQEPKVDPKARPALDLAAVEAYVRGVPAIDRDWLRRRSARAVVGVTAAEFLKTLYPAGERVLIFADQRSQGNFIFEAGEGRLAGSWRLSQQRGVHAVRSELPRGSKDGFWFLVQPVTGKWEIKRDVKYPEAGGRDVTAMYTRRSQGNVTAWRYFVLESDELNEALWLRVLVNLPMPIAAIYTSGGRSIHALIQWEVPSKSEWDAARNIIRQIVCPLGADPAALTAVRLSRLPGCLRGDRMQELIYLNPKPESDPLRLLNEVRE